MMVVEQVLQD